MPECDDEVGRLAATTRRGCVLAAAGCGKTEQIVRSTAVSDCKRLILTHTHAGVDAITSRLRKYKVPSSKFTVDTIAGWCLRFSVSFPHRSGFDLSVPMERIDWGSVYESSARLMRSGAVSEVIHASYGGVFVDEYQDCSKKQHEVICLLADELPCCIFGDPLQGIFDFDSQAPVDWDSDVTPVFAVQASLTKPWRWTNAGNAPLAEWLGYVRTELERGNPVDLRTRPHCVHHVSSPLEAAEKHRVLLKACMATLNAATDEKTVVLENAAAEASRVHLARSLARKGFCNIEPADCKPLAKAASRIDATAGMERFKALLEFACSCMTGADRAGLERAMESRKKKRKQGHKAFQELFPLADRVIETGSGDSMLHFLDAIHERHSTNLYRREMYFAMCAAIRLQASRPERTLSNAVWDVQNQIRHIGRRFTKFSIGSTLLVKGLEFDHSVIVQHERMTHKDLYVALTRATKSVRILAASELLVPFKDRRHDLPAQQLLSFIG